MRSCTLLEAIASSERQSSAIGRKHGWKSANHRSQKRSTRRRQDRRAHHGSWMWFEDRVGSSKRERGQNCHASRKPTEPHSPPRGRRGSLHSVPRNPFQLQLCVVRRLAAFVWILFETGLLTWSNAGGDVGCVRLTGSGSLSKIAVSTLSSLFPSNARRPVTIS